MMAMRQGSPENPLRTAVLISGSGSGMEALILHQKNPNCTHRTELVISNIAGVAGLEKAERHNVKSMAIEFGKHKIRVNTICPTFIKSNLTSKSLKDKKIRKWINSNIKLNRLAEVNDIMGAVIFLSSDASNMITGTSLMIDGGWTAG